MCPGMNYSVQLSAARIAANFMGWNSLGFALMGSEG